MSTFTQTAIQDVAGEGLTFLDPIKIAQAVAGTTEVAAAVAGKTIRLHALIGTLDADGTITIKSAGTALTGAIALVAKLPGVFGFKSDKRACLKTTVGEALNLTSVTGAFCGYAICSTCGD